ncbi:MAG: hypothetical protein M3Q22_06305 [Actinomycetota bacterium]|nr:hypothetical protein [Actinomycetota bacterium]
MSQSSRRPELDFIIVSLPDLLHFTRCADIEEVSAQVYDDSDVDTWVSTYADGWRSAPPREPPACLTRSP